MEEGSPFVATESRDLANEAAGAVSEASVESEVDEEWLFGVEPSGDAGDSVADSVVGFAIFAGLLVLFCTSGSSFAAGLRLVDI